MPIVLDVLTQLDARSVAYGARALEHEFSESGQRAGETFANQFASSMAAGFRDARFDSVIGALSAGGMAIDAAQHGTAIGVAFAGGIAAAASAALIDLGVKIGDTFEGINRDITLHTAASGKALDDLKSHADALVGSLDSSTASLGADMATLASRLQMTAGPALDQLTGHVEMLKDRMGNFNVDALSGALRNMGVSGAQADSVLASLADTARRTDIPLSELSSGLAANSELFKDLHLSTEQAGNMLGELSAKGVPANTALMSLQMGMKAAAKEGEDFNTFINRVAATLEDMGRRGDEAGAEQLSLAIGGARKWTDLVAAVTTYDDSRKQAFTGHRDDLTKLGEQTRTLGNYWDEVKNKIATALAPPGLSVTDEVGQKMEGLISFIDAHTDDLRQLFETSLHAIGDVAQGVGHIAAILGRHPALIEAVGYAFAAWESIKGVNAVLSGLEALGAWLVGAPAVAETAAVGVDAAMTGMAATTTAAGAEMGLAFGPIMGELAAMPAEAETAGTAITTSMTEADAAVLAFNGSLTVVLGSLASIGAALASVLAAKQAIDSINPGVNEAAPPPGKRGWWDTALSWMSGGEYDKHHPQPAQGAQQPPAAAGPAPLPGSALAQPGADQSRAAPTLPGAPVAPDAAGGLGGPPGDLLTPQMLDPGRAATLPKAPQVPYPAGYGAPPAPGETAEDYNAQQRVLEEKHAVDEAQARLNQLEQTNTATADDIQKARNDVLTAQRQQNAAELDLYQEQTRQLNRHSDEMGQLGAKIDQDFGISKGLAGIADNLTKFVANLAMAPVLGALNQIVDASGVKQLAPGAGGLIGMGAVSGMFGPQFMPGAGGVPGGVAPGPFGGYPGVKGAAGGGGGFGAAGYTSPAVPSISSPQDVATAGAGVANLYRFAESLVGTPYSMQLRNDCSGMVSRIASEAVGLGDQAAGQRFSTANEGQWLASHGFQSGMGGPGDLNIGWHIGGPAGGHTAATLPGGVNAEQGGSTPGDSFTLGPSAAGAANPEFEYHAHLPMGGLQPQWGAGSTMNTNAAGAVLSAPGYSGGGEVSGGSWGLHNISGNLSSAGHWLSHAASSTGRALQKGYQWVKAYNQNWGHPSTPSDPEASVRDLMKIGRPAQLPPGPGPASYLPDGTPVWSPYGMRSPSMGQEFPIRGLPDIPFEAAGFAGGGSTWGMMQAFPGGPRGSDTVPAWLTPDEHVLTVKDVQAMGGHDNVYAFRQALHAFAGGEVPYYFDDGNQVPQPGQQGPTQIGGAAPNAGIGSGMPGGGGGIIGGLMSAATQGAASAGGIPAVGGAAASAGVGAGMSSVGGGLAAGAGAGMASMGIGVAAQIAMQEIQRAIQYMGAVGGIWGEGLMETLLPTGGSQLAQNSWFTRIAGGLMGAQPQIPNLAGKSQNKAPHGVSGMGPEPGAPAGPQAFDVLPPSQQRQAPSMPQGPQGPPQGTAHAAPPKPSSALGPAGATPPGVHSTPTPSSVLGPAAGTPPAPSRIGAGVGTAGAAPAVYIEQYHAHDDPNTAGQDIARHTVASLQPSRGTSQWA